MRESEETGAHGGDEVGIGIEDDDTNPAGEATHESFSEDVAGAEREGVAEEAPGQGSSHDEGIDVALVIGAEKERTFFGQVFEAVSFEVKAVESEEIDEAAEQEENDLDKNIVAGDREDVGIGDGLGEDGGPGGSGGSHVAFAATGAGEHGIDKVADGIDFREL